MAISALLEHYYGFCSHEKFVLFFLKKRNFQNMLRAERVKSSVFIGYHYIGVYECLSLRASVFMG